MTTNNKIKLQVNGYLFNTKIAMSVGNVSSHFVCKWVQHAVMWVHGGKSVVLQLVSDN